MVEKQISDIIVKRLYSYVFYTDYIIDNDKYNTGEKQLTDIMKNSY